MKERFGMDIKFYTIGCPKCNTLKVLLDRKGVSFETIDNPDVVREVGISFGIKQAPFMVVDGNAMNFQDAVSWVKGQ